MHGKEGHMQLEASNPLVLAVDDEPGVLESYKVVLEEDRKSVV